MKKKRRLWLLLISIFVMIFTMQLVSFAAKKEVPHRSIAVVFDNSGSMYGKNNDSWCRAIYATEVFTSMANGEDDIHVYPMNPMTVDNLEYTGANPIRLKGGYDANTVRKMFTPNVTSTITPIETLAEAYQGLLQMPTGEKWLIILTDGKEFYDNRKVMDQYSSKLRITEELQKFSKDVNIMYLGIGANSAVPNVPEEPEHVYYAAQAKDSADVLELLTEMSNMIFGRDKLPVNENNQISFDINMKNLILFVQGEKISELKLLDSAGNEASTPVFNYSPKYSELGCDTKFKIDESLSGMIVSYNDIEAGEYSLSFTGNASNIDVYYEPDVDLLVFLVDAYGNPITQFDRVYPGDYKLCYGLVDQDGELTTSQLLGNRTFTVTYEIDGVEKVASSHDNGFVDIHLDENSKLKAVIDAEYLSGYKITKTSEAFGWPEGFLTVVPRPLGTLESSISGGEDVYTMVSLTESGVYSIQLYYDGRVLSGEDLERANIDVSWEDKKLNTTVEKKDNALLLQLGYGGEKPEDTQTGSYKMHINASYVNEYGKVSECHVSDVKFKLKDKDYSFKALIKAEQKYYQISKLDQAKPITILLTHDGKPLSPEQVEKTEAVLDFDGIEYTVEKDLAESALKIYIKPDQKIKSGKHKINAEVNSVDEIGRSIQDKDSTRVKFGILPAWLKWLVIGLIILALLILFWIWMNQKILPKQIKVQNVRFSVDGEPVTGTCQVAYSGKNHRKGSIDITSPKYPGNPAAKCGLHLDLDAISPRSQKSATRAAGVVDVRPVGGNNVANMKVGSVNFVRNETTGKFEKVGARARMAAESATKGKKNKNKTQEYITQLSNGAHCNVSGTVADPEGGTNDISLTFNLKYY